MAVATDIQKTRGDTSAIQTSVTSFLPPPSLLSPPHTLTDDVEKFHSALVEAESLIRGSNPSRALTLCSELIRNCSDEPDCDLALAWVHLVAGRALLEEVALSRPVLLEELWGETVGSGTVGSGTQRRKRGRGGRRGGKMLGWLSLVPEPFQEALYHFCTAVQLCHPVCPPQPLREVSNCFVWNVLCICILQQKCF